MNGGFVRFLILLSIVALLGFACSSGSDDEGDYALGLNVDASCTDITDYLLEFQAPYSRAFSANFSSSRAVVDLEEFPTGEMELALQLNGAYNYPGKLDRSWGAVANYNISCDEVTPKPILSLDLADIVLALSVPEQCNWFAKAEWFEVFAAGPSSDKEALQLLYASNPNTEGRRLIHMLKNGEDTPPLRKFMLRLTDGNGKLHDFRHTLDIEAGKLFNYVVACDAGLGKVEIDLQADGEPYDGASDGDEDGDMDGDADSESSEQAEDAETESEIDGDSEIVESDGDAEADVDEIDGDIDGDVDGDVDLESEVEAEGESGCDWVDVPDSAFSFYAKDKVLPSESTPGAAVEIVDATDNPAFSGEKNYAKLNATEIGHELALRLNIDTTYIYTLLIKYVKSDEWGKVEVYLDDETQPLQLQDGSGSEVDLASPTGPYNELLPNTATAYDPICLTGGEHVLRLRVSGTESSGYAIGVYRIQSTFEQPQE